MPPRSSAIAASSAVPTTPPVGGSLRTTDANVATRALTTAAQGGSLVLTGSVYRGPAAGNSFALFSLGMFTDTGMFV